ncbi:MAG: 6-phosphogluconolactonase [Synechococcales bacterium]|nr:6-phosphogluconolactonase [Synechococcales bacterium]
MTHRTVEVLPDKAALIQRSLELVCDQMRSAIADHGRCTIALSGGSTPKPLYEAIAAQDLPWEQIYVFWGDERYVPPDHPDSNEGMARAVWLDRVPIPAGNIYPMPTHAADPATAAATYGDQLQSFFDLPPGAMPALDIVLLGMGDDGHTASLFPHTEALQVRDRPVTVGSKNGEPRLTLTVPCINQARCVLFVVAGASKQPALAQVFAAQGDDQMYPSRLIQPQGQFWWLLDEAAAGLI